MKSRLVLGCVFVSLLFLVGCGRQGASAILQGPASPALTGSCNPATQWKPPANNIQLNDLAMVSPGEGWAVGNTTPSSFGPSPVAPAGVIYHYIDGQWVRQAEMFPNAPLAALSMDSPTDGWAVSTPDELKPGVRALVLHYSLGQWRPVDVPALDAVLNESGFIQTISVRMFGPNAGWIFAWTDIQRDPNNPESGEKVVILRFENGVWTPSAAPAVTVTTEMFALSAVSADEAWIVGTDYGSGGDQTTLFAHYVNGAWSLWPKTFPGVDEQFTMLSPTDGWAFDAGSGPTLLLHFDGTTWAPVAIPAEWASQGLQLRSPVLAVSPGVTWFGTYNPQQPGGISGRVPPMEQYANGQWQQVSLPFSTVLPQALSAASANDLWGVGDIFHEKGCAPTLVTDVEQGVLLRFQQGHWSDEVLP